MNLQEGTAENISIDNQLIAQYSTFRVSDRLYGVDVIKVQEVVKPLPMTKVPRAPKFISGLINLRGQVATAISLSRLFELESPKPCSELMNVVCKHPSGLISLLVDDIGDVVEVSKSDFEPTPQTVNKNIKKYMSGVFKTTGELLSILDIDAIMSFVNDKNF